MEYGKVDVLPDRAPSRMPSDGTGRVPDLVAAQPGAKAEVDVLLIGEEALVEPAELLKDGGPPERRCA